jgi:putative redox protein
VADTVRAAEYMRAEGRAVSLLVGHSFGGAAVLAAASEIAEVDAVATVGAPFSPKHVAHVFDAALDRILSEGSAEVDLGGKRVEIRRHFVEDLENADLTDCIRRLHKPLMVLHSPTDNTVGIENASTIFQTARHPRNFVSLEGSDHLLTGKGQAARAAKIIAAWADQYLDAGH